MFPIAVAVLINPVKALVQRAQPNGYTPLWYLSRVASDNSNGSVVCLGTLRPLREITISM